MGNNMRVGLGYDVHKFEADRELILGGVKIDYEYGLLGHSDADVLLHAIMDSLLGAAGMGDIGRHFSDKDPKYKGISSMKLLEEVRHKIVDYDIINIDSVVICQAPKLMNYIPQMEENIARVLDIEVSRVNVKATTTERLGFAGRKEGIASEAICLLSKK